MFNLNKNICIFEEIDSTQKEVLRRIESIKYSIVVISKIQTDGIGTHGRKWISNKNNITFSIGINFSNIKNNTNDDLLNVNINSIEGITIEFAKLLVNIFKSIYGIDCINIKYPNDLLINGKKIGGILTETKLVRDNVKYLIVGIGINTNQTDFDNLDIKDIASSIKIECKKEIDNNKVIFEFIKEFENCLEERIKNKK